MPRRKRRVLDNVATGISFAPILRESVAECIDRLPPNFYRLLARSPEQLAKWEYEKGYFMRVGQVLDTYFSGEAPPTFPDLSKHQRDSIEHDVWCFLSFYSMIFANWRPVKAALRNEKCPAIPILFKYDAQVLGVEGDARFSIPECKFSALDNPGKVLLKAMEYSAIRQMDYYFGKLSNRAKESNYAKRKWIIDVQKSRKPDASEDLVDEVEFQLDILLSSDPARWLETVCFHACYSNKKEGRSAETIESYMKAGLAREDFEKKKLHPQSKNRGVTAVV